MTWVFMGHRDKPGDDVEEDTAAFGGLSAQPTKTLKDFSSFELPRTGRPQVA
jgi:hypothetical protein